MSTLRLNWRLYFIGSLSLMTVFIWSVVFAENLTGELKVAFLDVGQGDAIFIEAPNGNQVLLDSGSNGKVLQELGKVMPFYDRTLDMIMISNPDADHIGGFLSVLERFDVSKIVEPGTLPETNVYKELEKGIAEKNFEKILGRRGQRFVLDEKDGVYLDILFPDRDVSGLKTNDGSLVVRLVYGNSSFLLTGDAPSGLENYLVKIDGKNLQSDVLKVAHHGSRNSSSSGFLADVASEYAVISVGAGNTYGHPHKETLDRLENFNNKVLRTDELGTIIFKTDGESIVLE